MPIDAFGALILLLSVTVAVGFVLLARRASLACGEDPRTVGLRWRGALAITLGWMVFVALLADQGILAEWERRPPLLPLLVGGALIGAGLVAGSGLGAVLARGLGLPLLAGVQCFRVAVELALHLGWREGLVPIQMTFHGWNADILTGLTAVPVALLLRRRPSRSLALAWNLFGLATLAWVLAIAVLSMPTPLRRFHEEPPLTAPARFPYVWLPGVLVPAAFIGHLLSLRALRQEH